MDSLSMNASAENDSVEGSEISYSSHKKVKRPFVLNMNISPIVSSENLFNSEHLWSIERGRWIDDVNN